MVPCLGSRIKSTTAMMTIRLENLVKEVTLFVGLIQRKAGHFTQDSDSLHHIQIGLHRKHANAGIKSKK